MEHDHHQHPHHATGTDESAMAEMIDLDAEVLHEYLSELTGWIQELSTPSRILDLGCGTGTGTIALLARFESADVVAVDLSEQLLHRLRAKAHDRGMADRVRTVQTDLDAGWPDVDPVDLVWASASMHHLADPDRVLADVLATLRPDGLLVVVELDSFPRFLPEGFGDGLEERCYAVLAEERAAHLPHMGSDWGVRLTKAGFTAEADRTFVVDLKAPLPEATGRYAQVVLRHVRSAVDGRVSVDDLALLDDLLDDDGLRKRDDLNVRATRTVWVARRP